MKVEFIASKEDYLHYHLFFASKFAGIHSKTKTYQLLASLIYAALGMIFYFIGQTPLIFVFIITAILWYFLYPKMIKKKYLKTYSTFVDEEYRLLIQQPCNVEINDKVILYNAPDSNVCKRINEIELVYESGTHFFIEFNDKHRIKKSKTWKAEQDITVFFNNILENHNIPVYRDVNWKW